MDRRIKCREAQIQFTQSSAFALGGLIFAILIVTKVAFGASSLAVPAASSVNFNSAIQSALAGKTTKAEQTLSNLLETAKGDQKDQVAMALGRVQFQAGKLDEAVETLDKVRKGSDFWFEALEEKAWVALRQKNPDKALSLLETAIKPLFLPVVGPESYFLAAYAHLRTCNYVKALEILESFKREFRPRIISLQEISRSAEPTENMQRALDTFLKDGFTISALKKDAHFLPRLLVYDVQLAEAFKATKASQSPTARAKFFDRLKALAKVDVTELARIINQFQILEIEITQRVYTKQPVASALKGVDEAPKMDSPTRIRFKHDREVWLDEVDKYHVRVKGCVPQGRGTEGKAI